MSGISAMSPAHAGSMPATHAGGMPATHAGSMMLTLTVAGQLCAVPVLTVRDVLGTQTITPIPLAPREVAGSLNLRGRIVTAIDLRSRLGLPLRPPGSIAMSVVVDVGGELYSLLADDVGEVLALDAGGHSPNPPTLDPSWKAFSLGVHRQEGRLLVLLDVDQLLALGA
jgi:purine-binding chemotaxis protein CheW